MTVETIPQGFGGGGGGIRGVGGRRLGLDLSAAQERAAQSRSSRGGRSRASAPTAPSAAGRSSWSRTAARSSTSRATGLPINEGTLCPKGAATLQLVNNEQRWTTVKYRAPGSDRWEEKPLAWAMERIAHLVKKTRDDTFQEHRDLPDGKGGTARKRVMHTTALASLGGATIDNEWNYAQQKLMHALGVVSVENQAGYDTPPRSPVWGSASGAAVPRLSRATSSTATPCSSWDPTWRVPPVAFRWPLRAKTDHGAVLMHVDPRFTRTSALCDVHVQIRAGTDIAFLGGLISQVIASERWNSDPFFREYVATYTNAARSSAPISRTPKSWTGSFRALRGRVGLRHLELAYQRQGPPAPSVTEAKTSPTCCSSGCRAGRRRSALQDPRCVFQIVRRHYAATRPRWSSASAAARGRSS